MEKLGDGELMARIAEGDRQAFAEIFRRHGNAVLGYCARLSGDRSTGEDLSQEVWVRVAKEARGYEHRGHFKAWLLTIARNLSLNHLQTARRLEPIGEIDEHAMTTQDPREGLEEWFAREEDRSALRRELDRLPDSQRTVLLLWMTEDLDYAGIAQALSTTESAVKSLLFRARATLEKTMKGGRP